MFLRFFNNPCIAMSPLIGRRQQVGCVFAWFFFFNFIVLMSWIYLFTLSSLWVWLVENYIPIDLLDTSLFDFNLEFENYSCIHPSLWLREVKFTPFVLCFLRLEIIIGFFTLLIAVKVCFFLSLVSYFFKMALFFKNVVDECFLCLYRFVHQRFKVITLTSWRIFRLRSAPAASFPRTHKLRSSLYDSEAKLMVVCGSISLLLSGFRYRQNLDTTIPVSRVVLAKDPVGGKKTMNHWSYHCNSSGFDGFPDERYITTDSVDSSPLIIGHSRLSNILPMVLVGVAIRNIKVNIFLVVWMVTTKNITTGRLLRLLVTMVILRISGVDCWNYINVVLACPLIKTETLHIILWAYFRKILQMIVVVLAELPTLKSCLMVSVIHLVRRESCCVPLICECADILLRVLTVSRMASRLQHPTLVLFGLLMGRSWFLMGYKVWIWHSEVWILPQRCSWFNMRFIVLNWRFALYPEHICNFFIFRGYTSICIVIF